MLRFEWDEEKREANRQSHGIDFESASLVLFDPLPGPSSTTLIVQRAKNAGLLWGARQERSC
jgi:uncharacterized DUF497 family protein